MISQSLTKISKSGEKSKPKIYESGQEDLKSESIIGIKYKNDKIQLFKTQIW